MAVIEGIRERIQAEIHQGNKKEEARAEEILEVPPEWNEVPDLMMEEEDVLPKATRSTKRRRDEISRGQRKRQKEEYIRPEKRGHTIHTMENTKSRGILFPRLGQSSRR